MARLSESQDQTDMLVIRRYRITGTVQGVFFRASTRREAERLGMSGHALNLDDGSVEVVAAGSAEAHRDLEAWLHRGPPAAAVTGVAASKSDGPVEPGFRTG